MKQALYAFLVGTLLYSTTGYTQNQNISQSGDIDQFCGHLLELYKPEIAGAESKKHSIVYLENELAAALDQAAMANVRARNELKRPESERTKKDPRSWLKRLIYGSSTNPVTLDLKVKIAKEEQIEKLAHQAVSLVDEYTKLEKQVRTSALLSREEQTAYEWVTVTVVNSLIEVRAMIKDISRAPQNVDRVIELQKTLETIQLNTQTLYNILLTRINPPSINPLITRLIEHLERRHVQAIQEAMTLHAKGGYPSEVMNGLANLSIRHQLSAQKIVSSYSEIHEKLRVAEMKDVATLSVVLTHIAFHHNKRIEQVADDYIDTYDQGGQQRSSYYIEENAAAVLLHFAYQNKASPAWFIDRYFEIEKLGRTTLKNFHLSDQSITLLAGIVASTTASPNKVMEEFFSIYQIGKSTESGFYINDLGVALLVYAKHEFGTKIEDVTNLFFEIKKLADESHSLPDIIDEDLSRLTIYALRQGIQPKALVKYLEKADQLDGSVDDLIFHRALTVLTLALRDAKLNGKAKFLNDLNFEKANRISYLELLTPEDILYEPRTSYNTAAYSSSYSSSNSSGLNIVADMDEGMKPSLGLGSGLSMDLTDGSMKINLGGGITFDTDGDGFGIKLF